MSHAGPGRFSFLFARQRGAGEPLRNPPVVDLSQKQPRHTRFGPRIQVMNSRQVEQTESPAATITIPTRSRVFSQGGQVALAGTSTFIIDSIIARTDAIACGTVRRLTSWTHNASLAALYPGRHWHARPDSPGLADSDMAWHLTLLDPAPGVPPRGLRGRVWLRECVSSLVSRVDPAAASSC